MLERPWGLVTKRGPVAAGCCRGNLASCGGITWGGNMRRGCEGQETKERLLGCSAGSVLPLSPHRSQTPPSARLGKDSLACLEPLKANQGTAWTQPKCWATPMGRPEIAPQDSPSLCDLQGHGAQRSGLSPPAGLPGGQDTGLIQQPPLGRTESRGCRRGTSPGLHYLVLLTLKF